MAACRGLHHIFDNQIPENLTSFIDSLSSSPWSKIKPSNPIDQHSFTEIFGELHFKENPNNNNNGCTQKQEEQEQEEEKWRNISKFSPYHKRSESSSSSMNSESLQLCTEGLGFESLDNLEDLKILDFQSSMREKVVCERSRKEKKGVKERGLFPPPISSIGGNNNVGKKPWVSFESYREDGRFILKEIRIPSQECLHACREDGRLRLSFVQESDNEDEDGFESFDEEDDGGEEEEREREGMNHGGQEEEEEEKEAKINLHDFGRGD